MFSFDEGRPICHVINTNTGNIENTIKVLNEEEKEPHIIVDDVFDLLEESDINKVVNKYKLNETEKDILKKCIEKNDCEGLPKKIVNSYKMLEKSLEEKTKKELIFDNDRICIPAIGMNDTPFDRHIWMVAGSGSGKTTLIAKILEHDKMERPILMISKKNQDPSIDYLKEIDKKNKKDKNGDKNGDKKRTFRRYIIDEQKDLVNMPRRTDLADENGIIVIFDDIEFDDSVCEENVRNLQHDLLTHGRQDGISVLSSSHELNMYNKTKRNKAESEYICLFPSTDVCLSEELLKSLKIEKKRRDYIIDKCSKNRYMIVKKSHPVVIIHEHGLILV